MLLKWKLASFYEACTKKISEAMIRSEEADII